MHLKPLKLNVSKSNIENWFEQKSQTDFGTYKRQFGPGA